jgi:hypothetical protein
LVFCSPWFVFSDCFSVRSATFFFFDGFPFRANGFVAPFLIAASSRSAATSASVSNTRRPTRRCGIFPDRINLQSVSLQTCNSFAAVLMSQTLIIAFLKK